MNKTILVSFLALASAVGMVSCGSPGNGKPLSEIRGSDAKDSLLYYFGQMEAAQYWRDSAKDSLLQTEASRMAYLKGLMAGLKAIKEDENYNRGLVAGVRMAVNMRDFEKEYGVELNPGVIVESLEYGLRSDSIVDEVNVTRQFYDLLGYFQEKRDAADKSASEKVIKDVARKMGLYNIAEGIYGKTLTPGHGPALVDGDKVRVSISLTSGGQELGIPMPEEVAVGDHYVSSTLNTALRAMHVGEKCEYAVTAYKFFGRRCTQIGLQPTDVVIMTVDVKEMVLPHSAQADEAEP